MFLRLRLVARVNIGHHRWRGDSVTVDDQSVAEVPVEALLCVAHGSGEDPRVLVLDVGHSQSEARDLVAGVPRDGHAVFIPATCGTIQTMRDRATHCDGPR